MNTTRRLVTTGMRVLIGAGALGLIVGLPAQPSAADDPELAGYQGSAQADGVHALYNPAGVLPIGPPVDLGVPDAFATVASGRATFARASTADPGDVLANPDALLAQGAPGYPPGTVPAYPFRAVASTGTDPHAESNPAPGLNARADATSEGSTALARTPALEAPSLVTIGSVTSKATTEIDGSTVTVRAQTRIGDVQILGLVSIGSVVTDITATSDGTKTVSTGRTVLTGGSVAGTPVTIDASGVKDKPGEPVSPLGAMIGDLLQPGVTSANELLARLGIRVSVMSPQRTGTGNSTQLVGGGLAVDFEFSDRTYPSLRKVLDQIPSVDNPVPGAPGLSDLLAVVKARHLTSLRLGRGVVTLSATSSVADPAVSADVPAATSSGEFFSGSTEPGLSPIGPGLVPSSPVLGSTQSASSRVPISAGIGGALLLALLIQPLLANWLARGVESIVAADNLTPCSREKQ